MNKMAEVAKILGVQLGEKFDIEGLCLNPYTIAINGLIDKHGDRNKEGLTKLLTAEYMIVKRPFKPAKGEEYWCVVNGKGVVDIYINDHYCNDYHRISMGNCFRTREEAEAYALEIVKKMRDFFAEV